MGGATATKEGPKQKELDGMPTRSGLGKLCYDRLIITGQIRKKKDDLAKQDDKILSSMKEQKKEVVKFQDPDTKEYYEFKVNVGHDKVGVRKIPNKQET